jgi:phage terminase large subunit
VTDEAAADSDVVQVALPLKLITVFDGEADVRGAFGGRGSAKTRSFAKMTAVRAIMFAEAGISGAILCAREFQNSLDDSSMAEVKAAILDDPWLTERFDIGEKYIRTKDRRVTYLFAGLQRNIASIKSKFRILLCWVDEAEGVPESSWEILLPTLREEVSELWVTWNPGRKASATDKRFRQDLVANPDLRVKVIELNWRDNPRFPDKLNRQRLRDKRDRPDSYDHIWEGAYITAIAGAYYAKSLTACREEGRITKLAADDVLRYKVFADLGGTGARADAFAMWLSQFVGPQVRALWSYEAVGQPLAAHVLWLSEHGFHPHNTDIWLPHDGNTADRVFSVSFKSGFEAAGYAVTVVANQGAGAAMQRVNAARRMFPNVWFDDEQTQAGREALGWYHEKRHELRDVGLGPEHDWSSHVADAFGLMGVVYESTVGAGHAHGTKRGAGPKRRRRGSPMAA